MNSTENILYDYDDKKKIVFRIQNLKYRKFYIKLFKIVLQENIDYNSNNNGVFFNINKLSNTQFDKIKNLLDVFELSSQIDSESLQESENTSFNLSESF
jgi:hypothetical protein